MSPRCCLVLLSFLCGLGACLNLSDARDVDLGGSALVLDPATIDLASQSSTQLTVQLRRGDGRPVPVATVAVVAPLCAVEPAQLTLDASGNGQVRLYNCSFGAHPISAQVLSAGFRFDVPATAVVTVVDSGQFNGTTGTTVGTAVRLSISMAGTSSAGATTAVRIAALDAQGNVVPAFQGPLILSSTDPVASFVSKPSIGAADGGSISLPGGIVFKTAGSMQLQAGATGVLSGAATCAVAAAATSRLQLTQVPSTSPQGQPFSAKVKAVDAYGNATPSYGGTVSWSSSDPQATLPAAYGFVAADQGSHLFANGLTLNTLGSVSTTVSDTGTLGSAGAATANTTVVAPPCRSFGRPPSMVQSSSVTNINSLVALALDSQDRPWIAWPDTSQSSSAANIYLAAWDGAAWNAQAGSLSGMGVNTGAASNSLNLAPSLALAANDVPQLAWTSLGSSQGAVLFAQNVGAAWPGNASSQAPAGLTGLSTRSNKMASALAISTTGVPYVAWIDSTKALNLLQWDGSAWSPLAPGQQKVTTGALGIPSLIATDPSHIYVAWTAVSSTFFNPQQIYLAWWNGSSWASLGGSKTGDGLSKVPFPGDANSPALALQASGYPAVAWDDDRGTSASNVYYRAYDGVSAWGALGSSGSGTGISANQSNDGTFASLAMGADGYPVVAWQQVTDSGTAQIFMRRWDGSSWASLGVSATSGVSAAAGTNQPPVVRLTRAGGPILAWQSINGSTNTLNVCAWQ